jgi:hypothetical protein
MGGRRWTTTRHFPAALSHALQCLAGTTGMNTFKAAVAAFMVSFAGPVAAGPFEMPLPQICDPACSTPLFRSTIRCRMFVQSWVP